MFDGVACSEETANHPFHDHVPFIDGLLPGAIIESVLLLRNLYMWPSCTGTKVLDCVAVESVLVNSAPSADALGLTDCCEGPLTAKSMSKPSAD